MDSSHGIPKMPFSEFLPGRRISWFFLEKIESVHPPSCLTCITYCMNFARRKKEEEALVHGFAFPGKWSNSRKMEWNSRERILETEKRRSSSSLFLLLYPGAAIKVQPWKDFSPLHAFHRLPFLFSREGSRDVRRSESNSLSHSLLTHSPNFCEPWCKLTGIIWILWHKNPGYSERDVIQKMTPEKLTGIQASQG